MATSSSILQSFLRDALNENRNLSDLSYEELLNYNRAQCGLIQINFDPQQDSKELETTLSGNNAIILYDDELFHAYKDADGYKVRKLPEPTDSKKLEHYNRLKKLCPQTYKRARGEKLDWIRALTDRAYTEHRSDHFLSSLDFYLGILGNTDSVMIHYMDEAQKEELRFNLKITLLLLAAQQKHEIEYQKTENAQKYGEYIKKCSKLLMKLDPEYRKRIRMFQADSLDEQPIKYMGIPIGQLLASNIVDLSGGTTKSIKDFMGKINENRLYWVWGSSLSKTVIDLVPENYFFETPPGQLTPSEAIRFPDPFTGNLSWTLYYARFFLELSLLLKHTIKGPWMSEEEAKTPWEERFLTQWSQRKFALLNDSIWGTANLVSYFWLTGKGVLGTAGDALTLALLVFDIAMAVWDFEEQRIKYNKAMLQYDEDIERLRNQLKVLKQKQSQDKNDIGQISQIEIQRQICQIEMQIRTLEREKSKCERDWQLQKVSLINNIAYAVGLMLAFMIMTMPFMPIAAPALATMAIAGAVLCFAFTVINNAIKGGIELYKTHTTIQEQQNEYDLKVNVLTDLLRKNQDLDTNEKKLLYLEIMQCQAETEYQKQMRVYQTANLVRSITIEALLPAVAFASLVFVPLGIGIPVLIAAVAIAIATKILVEVLFKPEEKKALEFDEGKYEEFCQKILEKPKPERTRFSFGDKKEPILTYDRVDDDFSNDFVLELI